MSSSDIIAKYRKDGWTFDLSIYPTDKLGLINADNPVSKRQPEAEIFIKFDENNMKNVLVVYHRSSAITEYLVKSCDIAAGKKFGFPDGLMPFVKECFQRSYYGTRRSSYTCGGRYACTNLC